MSRSDSYGGSSHWRNSCVQDASRLSSLKKYFVAVPLFLATLFSPQIIDISSARIPNKPEFFVHQKTYSLEKRIQINVDDFLLKKDLVEQIESKIDQLTESEGSKKEIERTLSKLSAYDSHISDASRETGLDISFIKAYIAQESRGNPHAESSRGAKGLGELRKAAAREQKLRVDSYVDERVHPKAILASAEYMKKGINRFGYLLGLVAYNAGSSWTSENFERILREGTISKNSVIPLESRNYVVEVLARKRIFSDPGSYNLRFKKKEPILSKQYKTHFTKRDINLKRLAHVYGVNVKEVKDTNPFIKTNMIPKGTVVYIPSSS